MLDFYETETNNFKAEIKPFDPRKICAYLKAIYSPIIDHKNVKVYFLIHDRVPALIYHDLKRITKMLVNIMGNAVKYTKKGIISIMIDWETFRSYSSKDKGMIKFTVSDTGCGIPKSKRKHLFSFLDPQNFKEHLLKKE